MTATESNPHDCAMVRWLPCDECGGEGEVDGDPVYNPFPTCDVCVGTGLRFQGLSFDCSDSGSTICPISLGLEDVECDRCQGRGRVPVDTLEAWLDAGSVAGYPHFGGGGDVQSQYAILRRHFEDKLDLDVVIGRGETRLEAVKNAICRATGSNETEKVKA